MIDGMLTSDNDKSPIEWEDLPDTCPVCDSATVSNEGLPDSPLWVCGDCGAEWDEDEDEPGEGDLDEF